jgi:choline dehydrogenase-like flavoprotein
MRLLGRTIFLLIFVTGHPASAWLSVYRSAECPGKPGICINSESASKTQHLHPWFAGDSFEGGLRSEWGRLSITLVLGLAIILRITLPWFSTKRIITTQQVPEGDFDYIVVGGGLAGSVLAARLSEDSEKRVLVIEPGIANPNSLLIRISGAILKLFRNPTFDWCWKTAAELGCHGRSISLCRGKLLGGSSCLSAQVALRASPSDYDSWGSGWTSAEVAPVFDRLEMRDEKMPMASCGMCMQVPNYQHELSKRFLSTCKTKGAHIHPDLQNRESFNDWTAENVAPRGFGRFELAQKDGVRWTGANSYFAVAAARPNVVVLTGHAAARIALESRQGKTFASGVEVFDCSARAKATRTVEAQEHVTRVTRANAAKWSEMNEHLLAFEQDRGDGSSVAVGLARAASARKLITNHEAVLRDAVNPDPLTQHHLARVSPAYARYVDEALYELATLLTKRVWPGGKCPAPTAQAKSAEQASAWSATARYLERRLQYKPEQYDRCGRPSDMDPQAAEVFCEALLRIRETAEESWKPRPEVEETTHYRIPTQKLRLASGGEVLLSAGTLNSPHLLQLSGIGEPSVLEAAGIAVSVPLPGVGQGVQDHPAVSVAYESRIRDGMAEIKPFMPWLSVVSPRAIYKWAVEGSGILSTTFCDHGAFVRSNPSSLELADLQLRFVPGIGPSADGVKAYELLGRGIQHPTSGFTVQVINCRPRSVGTVKVVSPNPSHPPEIRCNYLERKEDLQCLRTGVALARKLSTSGDLADVSTLEVYPGPRVQDGDDLDEFIRQTLHSANGLAGGCCIGSVVDQQLKVNGVGALRVTDASVMPRILGGQLALPTAMIAERAASMIKSDRSGT